MVMYRFADYFIFIKMPVIFLSAGKNAFFPCILTISFDYDVEKLKYDVE
jgi:hypothetical protein